jgi:flagellin-like hook-associated protein FlgL
MPIVINTNAAASSASFNLSKNAEALRKSLSRLSSGNRITQPAEDAGGLAVAYKLDSHIRRSDAVLNNHQNALSFLQVQDGALETVGNVVNRMSELRTMAADITKNTSDVENYSKEFRELQVQLNQLQREKFNGVSLFSSNSFVNPSSGSTNFNRADGTELSYSHKNDTGKVIEKTYKGRSATLLTHPSGLSNDGSISLNATNLQWVLTVDTATTSLGASRYGANGSDLYNIGGFENQGANKGQTANGLDVSGGIFQDITKISIYQFTHIIEKIADARAENGAEQNRIQQSYDFHSTNLVNLEAAHGRIMDVDVALESTRFAKHNVLVQASASMTAQANQLTQVALTLLQ